MRGHTGSASGRRRECAEHEARFSVARAWSEGLSKGGRLQAFVEKESGLEGAEVPRRAAESAGQGEAGVHMNAKHFWRELGGALGMNLGVFSTCPASAYK